MDSKRAIKQLLEIKKYGKAMRLAAEEWGTEWQTLIAIILSARTRDEVTIEVCKKLFGEYGSLKGLAHARAEGVSKVIKPVNFYKNKTRNIINCAKMLLEKFEGKVPHDIDKLVELPGVGRKTANVFLAEEGYDNVGVDTHLAYCSRKLGWTKNVHPHKIEQDLMTLFPKKYWNSLNPILVHFGKTFTSRRKKDELLEQVRKIR